MASSSSSPTLPPPSPPSSPLPIDYAYLITQGDDGKLNRPSDSSDMNSSPVFHSSSDHSSASSSSSSAPRSTMISSSNVKESDKLTPGLSLQRVATAEVSEMKANTWTNIDASSFLVRIGPNYAKNKKKHPSRPALFDCVAIDFYATNEKISDVGRLMKFPCPIDNELKASTPCGANNCTGVPYLPTTVLINFQIPGYPVENAIWGKKVEDGPGTSLVFLYVLSNEAKAHIRRACIHHKHHNKSMKTDNHDASSSSSSSGPSANCEGCSSCSCPCIPDEDLLPPSLRLLKRFVEAQSGTEIRARLKAICRLVNVEESGLGGMSKKLVNAYNGTPFLIRTTSVFYRGEANSYFEIDVDVHRFSYPARVGLSGVREHIKDVIFDFAFVVEGADDDELPEQILAAARLAHLNMSAATPFPQRFLSSAT